LHFALLSKPPGGRIHTSIEDRAVQIDTAQSAIFQRIARPHLRAVLQETPQYYFPEVSMSHNTALMLSRIGFLM
jgi:hypothetical protein